MSKQEQAQSILNTLRSSMPEIKGALIATVDGLAISRSFSDTATDTNRVAAMAATALGLGKRIADTLNAGEFTETSVSGREGNVYIYATGPKGVLAVITQADANLGLVHLESRDAARQISSLL